MSACPQCQVDVPPDSLVCHCGALVHAEELKRLHVEALRLADEGALMDAAKLLAECLTLLPKASRQHTIIENRLAKLSACIAAEPPGAFEPEPPFVPQNTALLLVKGLFRPATLVSCVIWVGAAYYVLNIKPQHAIALAGMLYIHEMGHVVAMNLLRIPFSWPVFVPLLGAFVLRKRHKVSARDRVLISLCGPLLGLLASCALIGWHHWISQLPAVVPRLAGINALINGLNLLPFWMLDGGHIADLSRRIDLFAAALLLGVAGVASMPGKTGWLIFLSGVTFVIRAALHKMLIKDPASCTERAPIWSAPATAILLALSFWLLPR
jgi:Zn-dependent protease